MLRGVSALLIVLALSEKLWFLCFLVSSKLPSTRLPDSSFSVMEIAKPLCFTNPELGISVASNSNAQKCIVSDYLPQ